MQPDPEVLVTDLKKAGTKTRASHEKRYLKSAATFYGVTVPRSRALVRPYATAFRRAGDLGGALRFAKALWSDGAHEARMSATFVVAACEPHYDDRVWKLGVRWVGQIDNWALCDSIGPSMLSPFVQHGVPRYRARRREVCGWTEHKNLWIRRGALLSAMRPIRVDHDCEFVLEVGRRLLSDPEYFVQKGLGWMLRECAHHRPREVITFIQSHRNGMRRSTVTNAISRLPKTLQQAARTGQTASRSR